MATLETCLMGSKECPQLVTTSSAQKTIRKGGVDVPVLFVAAENGLVKTFEAILKNGGSIDVTDTLGNNINEYLAAVMAKMAEGRNFDNYIEKITPIKMLIGKIYNEKRSSGKNIRVNNPFGANTPAPAPPRVNAGASANPFTPAEAGAGGPAEYNPFEGGRRNSRNSRNSRKSRKNKNKRTKTRSNRRKH